MTVDLRTTYMGLQLAHPVLPSASPLTGDLDHLHSLVEAGAPAVVLPSLFEEQIEHDAMAVHFGMEQGAGGFAEAASGYLPDLDDYNTGPARYLDLVSAARAELKVPAAPPALSQTWSVQVPFAATPAKADMPATGTVRL